jgi:hypothetical protein
MKRAVWFFLIVLAIAPAVRGETYVYCSSMSASRSRVYFSEIFTPLSGIDSSRFEKEFIYYLAVHYGESIAATARCTSSSDMHQALAAKTKDLHSFENMRWQTTLTRWKY